MRTLAGAAVSITGIIVMIVLFFGELSMYLNVQTDHQLSVDTTRGEKLQVMCMHSRNSNAEWKCSLEPFGINLPN